MATVYSNEVSVGSYNRIRIKLDYSGTSATATIQFRRTSSYSTTWSDNNATLKIGDTTKAANYSYSGTVGTSWVDLRSNITGFTVSTSGGTYNWTFTNSGGGVLGCSGTITVPAQASPPSGLSVTLSSRTWQSVNIRVDYSSLGTGSFRYTEAKVFTTDSTGYWSSEGTCKGRWEQYSTAAGTHTFTIDNSDNAEESGGINIRGCTAFKIGGCIATTDGDQHSILSTIYYTPPAPLQSITQSQVSSQTSNSVTHTITITGGNSTNNKSENVSTWYRVSTDGGSTYTTWTQAGTGTPWTAKTATFTSTYGASIKVEARQAYQNLYSETKTLSYTANAGTPPSGFDYSVVGTTWNTVTLTGSITSYGTPSQVSGRKIAIGVSESQGTIAVKRENQLVGVLSGTTTVTNSSVYPGATALTLRGCKTVWPYVWATNTVASDMLYGTTSVTTNPATPTLTAENIGGSIEIWVSGNDNNESAIATFRYCIYEHGEPYQEGGAGAYQGWTDLGTYDAQTGRAYDIPEAEPGRAYDIYAELVYQNKHSELAVVENVLVTNPPTFEDFDYEDSNPLSVAVTGDNQVFIQGVSIPKVIITQANKAIAAPGAIMEKYIAGLGGNPGSVEIAYSDNSDVEGLLDPPVLSGDLELGVTARDNNNGRASAYKTVQTLSYSIPTLVLGNVERTDRVGNISLTLEGTYSPLEMGGVEKNTPKVEYRVVRADGGESTEWGELEITPSAGTFSGEIALWLLPSSGWTIEVKVTDSLGNEKTQSVEVPELREGALAAPQYDIELWDWHTRTFKMDITKVIVDGIHVKWKVNDVESINFSVDLVQFEELCRANNTAPIDVLKPYVMDVRIRRNSEYIVGGQIVETNIDISENKPATVEVKCSGFLNLFKDQYLSMPYGGYKYSEIARELVQWAQRGRSIIKNPTADIDVSYWISDGPMTISKDGGRSGSGGVRSVRSTAGWATVATQMKVKAGDRVTISPWVTGQGGRVLQVVERPIINSSAGQRLVAQVTTTVDGQWYNVPATFTAQYDNSYIYFQQERTTAGGIRIDDARVYLNNENDTLRNLQVPLGVNTASGYQTSGKALNYQLQNVKDALQELTTLGGNENENFDFEFEPDRTFNCYHQLGTTRTDLLVEYPGNISQLKITRSAANLANSVTNMGSGIGDERLETRVFDTDSMQLYGTHESVFTSNGTDIAENISLQAQSELNARKDPTNLPQITISDGSVNPSNLKIGDKFYLKIYEDEFIGTTSGLFRVMEYQLDVDQDDNEKVSLTVEEAE